MKKGILVLGVLIFIFSLHACAVPQQINFQGRLVSSDATPITSNVSVTFDLYDDVTSGNKISTETRSVTPNSNGAFSVLLGFNPSTFDESDRWIGVKVGTDSEMTPRQKFAAVPYAFYAITAESVVGGNYVSKTGDKMTGKLTIEVSSGGAAEIGGGNVASGDNSVAMGLDSTASGPNAIAVGNNTRATGEASIAMGDSTRALWAYSAAMGDSTTASGYASTAMGSFTSASGSRSTAIGYFTTASGDTSTAMGYWTTAQPYASLAIGRYNVVSGTPGSWVDTEPVFIIGNGASAGSPSNALTVLKNGNVGIGTTEPVAKLDVNGTAKIAKVLTEAKTSLTTTDFGKTITAAGAQTITLPDISATDIGATFTIVKLGTDTVTIDAVGSDVIAGSTAGGGICNNSAAETFANITIQVAADNKWIIVGGHGTWTTF